MSAVLLLSRPEIFESTYLGQSHCCNPTRTRSFGFTSDALEIRSNVADVTGLRFGIRGPYADAELRGRSQLFFGVQRGVYGTVGNSCEQSQLVPLGPIFSKLQTEATFEKVTHDQDYQIIKRQNKQ